MGMGEHERGRGENGSYGTYETRSAWGGGLTSVGDFIFWDGWRRYAEVWTGSKSG